MVARFPESDAIIPVLIFKSLANQEAEDPESAERMQFSGSLFDNSQKTRCGFSGYAAFIARASNIFHHRSISLMTRFCHSLFSLRFNKGISDCKVFFTIALQVNISGISNAQHLSININLHRFGLPFLWKKFRIRKAGTDHEECVALHHEVITWFCS